VGYAFANYLKGQVCNKNMTQKTWKLELFTTGAAFDGVQMMEWAKRDFKAAMMSIFKELNGIKFK
jgi:hypothetical protein